MSLADELRAAATRLRETAGDAQEATMTGKGEEWKPWDLVHGIRPSQGHPTEFEPTGRAAVVHDQYAHNHEEDWYETFPATSSLDARVAAWIVLANPALAEPLADLLHTIAVEAERHEAKGWGNTQSEVIDDRYLRIAREINGGQS